MCDKCGKNEERDCIVCGDSLCENCDYGNEEFGICEDCKEDSVFICDCFDYAGCKDVACQHKTNHEYGAMCVRDYCTLLNKMVQCRVITKDKLKPKENKNQKKIFKEQV